MLLAYNNMNIPIEWYHDPVITDENGKTVAMYLGKQGIIPDIVWQHDPLLKDKYGRTVAIYLI